MMQNNYVWNRLISKLGQDTNNAGYKQANGGAFPRVFVIVVFSGLLDLQNLLSIAVAELSVFMFA